MIACYIIFSKKHNDGSYGDHRFTAKANDWELFICIECDSFKLATAIERHIKKMKSSTYIKNLKLYPEMIDKVKKIKAD